MDDAVYDALSRQVDLSIQTGRPELDQFFQQHFTPDSGMWIWHHPEQDGIEEIYNRYFFDAYTRT